LQAKRIALLARKAAADKKGEDPVVLDISKLTSIAHYFVIVHGNSDRHVKTLARHIMDIMKEKKVSLWHDEGLESGSWVVLDYASVIIHVFYRDTRQFYNLECLWGEAVRL
jgi:ribosome-associated protein